VARYVSLKGGGLLMQNSSNIVVTTADLKCDYEIIGPVFFQVSNKGFLSNELSDLFYKYSEQMDNEKEGDISKEKTAWETLYGEWSLEQSDYEKAFFVAVEELKLRAAMLGADAIVGMKQDIDLETNGFRYFYLQMYGTAVKFK